MEKYQKEKLAQYFQEERMFLVFFFNLALPMLPVPTAQNKPWSKKQNCCKSSDNGTKWHLSTLFFSTEPPNCHAHYRTLPNFL